MVNVPDTPTTAPEALPAPGSTKYYAYAAHDPKSRLHNLCGHIFVAINLFIVIDRKLIHFLCPCSNIAL